MGTYSTPRIVESVIRTISKKEVCLTIIWQDSYIDSPFVFFGTGASVHSEKKLESVCLRQWRNRRGGGRGAECPQRFLTGKFLLTYWEKRDKEKKGKGVEIEKKRRKIVKGKMKIGNGSRKSYKNRWGPFFFFFFSLLKTTEICFGCTKMGIFYRKKHSRQQKN